MVLSMNNQLKTVLFLGLLTGLLLGVGQLLGGRTGLIIAFIFALVMNFFTYWFSDKFVLKIYHAYPAKREKYKLLYEDIKYIAERAKMPMPKVYIIPGTHANAFCTGRNPKHAVVACTEGILDLLNRKELKGVLAHEIAHAKNRDILISSVAAVIAGAISFLASMAQWAAIFGFGGRDDNNGGIIGVLLLAILTPIIASLIHLAISRSREYQADKVGAELIKDSHSLADALQKLHAGANYNPMKNANNATAHMFIVNPLKNVKWASLFSTHPDVNSRIGRLRSMKF